MVLPKWSELCTPVKFYVVLQILSILSFFVVLDILKVPIGGIFGILIVLSLVNLALGLMWASFAQALCNRGKTVWAWVMVLLAPTMATISHFILREIV